MIRTRPFATFLLCCALTGWAQDQQTPAANSVDKEIDGPPTRPNEDARDRVLFADETERIGPLSKKLLRNVLMDQKDIWTSPLRMSRNDAISWLIIGGATGALIASDDWSSRQLPNTVDQVAVSKD